MKQNNWTTSCTQNEAESAGDFDLTGKCDWKRDRKCLTKRMRRRFAAVFPRPHSLWRPSVPGNDSWARIPLWLVNKMAPSSLVGRKMHGLFAVKIVKWLKQISYSGSRLRTADCWTLSGNTTYVKMSLAIVKFVLVVNKVGNVTDQEK